MKSFGLNVQEMNSTQIIELGKVARSLRFKRKIFILYMIFLLDLLLGSSVSVDN